MSELLRELPPTTRRAEEIAAIDRWWRAANYLSAGQIYLRANPLLRRPLQPADIKPRLLGHWGTAPGLTFIQAHLNRIIARDDRDILFVCGPGHGGPAILACGWLDGGYQRIYPDVSRDLAGMERLFHRFSAPGGVPSHTGPKPPGRSMRAVNWVTPLPTPSARPSTIPS